MPPCNCTSTTEPGPADFELIWNGVSTSAEKLGRRAGLLEVTCVLAWFIISIPLLLSLHEISIKGPSRTYAGSCIRSSLSGLLGFSLFVSGFVAIGILPHTGLHLYIPMIQLQITILPQLYPNECKALGRDSELWPCFRDKFKAGWAKNWVDTEFRVLMFVLLGLALAIAGLVIYNVWVDINDSKKKAEWEEARGRRYAGYEKITTDGCEKIANDGYETFANDGYDDVTNDGYEDHQWRSDGMALRLKR